MKLDEIAKLAGVSCTTVSYVVNGKAKQYRVSRHPIHEKARTLYGLFFRLYVSYRLRFYVSFCLLGLLQPIRILCELFVSCCMSPVSSLFVSCYTSPASSFLDSEALL